MSNLELLKNIPGVEDLSNENAANCSGGNSYYVKSNGKWYLVNNKKKQPMQTQTEYVYRPPSTSYVYIPPNKH